jgi:TonB family protein
VHAQSVVGSGALAPGWQRLGASFTASLALHAAALLSLVLLLPPLAPRADRAEQALVVRLAPPAAPAAHPKAAEPRARPAPKRPAQPRAAAEARAGRVAYADALAAYQDLDEDLQMEKLDAAQRSVPRSIDFPRPAKPLAPIRPVYPRGALARGERGNVLLEAFVGADGRVEQIVLLEDGGAPHFAQAAAEALRRTRFRAAEGPAGKTRSRVTLRFTFRYE